jgi:Uncharacterized conserved protein
MLILLTISIFCFLYYVLIITYAHPQISFVYFWPIMGSLMLITALIKHYIDKKHLWNLIPLQCKTVFFTTVGFFALVFLIVEVLVVGAMFRTTPKNSLDYILVLGAAVYDGEPSPTLRERLDKAAVYLRENEEVIVILSGGMSENEIKSEASVMEEYLIEKGIDSSRIKLEGKSTNTNENLLFSKQLIETEDAKIGIITSDFHIFRATSLAKQVGFKNPKGISVQSNVFMRLHYIIREGFAVIKDKFMGNM